MTSLCLFEGSAYSDAPLSGRELFLTSALDGALRLWDLRDARRGAVRVYRAHTNRVHAMQTAISPCLRYVCCGSEDRKAYLYDLGSEEVVARLTGHTDAVTAVSFNPLHPQLSTASLDGTVRLYSDRDAG